MSDLKDACSIVISHGFAPVNASAYERLRAWLDATNGWPPTDWQPGDPVPGRSVGGDMLDTGSDLRR